MKIKAVIIEDEYPAARLLKQMVENIRPSWDVAILPGNIEKAVSWFKDNEHPDIIFLDIELSDGESFSFIERAKPQCRIIFTTAYDKYAVRAFDVNGIDYILKPVIEDRLEQAILKFEELYEKRENNYDIDIEKILKSITNKDKNFKSRFLVSFNGKFEVLKTNEVSYFVSENKSTYAVTYNGKKYALDYSINDLEGKLDNTIFFRINRQYLISIDSIKKIEMDFNNRYIIKLKPETEEKITVSKDRVNLLKMWLNS